MLRKKGSQEKKVLLFVRCIAFKYLLSRVKYLIAPWGFTILFFPPLGFDFYHMESMWF
jgi:hypothetical protein